MAGQERTEAATPKRRQDARQKGQVARSQDLNGAIAALGGFGILAFYAPPLYGQLGQTMRQHFQLLGGTELTQGEVVSLGLATMMSTLLALAPVMFGLLVLGVAGNVLQIGFLLSAHPLKPDFSKLNPIRGLGRIFSPMGLFELVKAAMKAVVIGYLAYSHLESNQPVLLMLAHQELSSGVATLARLGLELALKMAAAALVLAVIDLGIQRIRHTRQLRMTRHEVQEELKQTEGHPRLKGHFREMRRKLASRRMMQAVPHADVVITNPTHLAIALKYDAARMRAPEVVAKGEDLLAQRIKDVARTHNVPLMENKPLAQTLHRTVDVGMAVPSSLFQAVAEVLAFVYALRQAQGGRRGMSEEARRG